MQQDSSQRIVQGLSSWIDSAAPGAKLPSTRQLVQDYSASPVTVQKALRQLAVQGLVESRPGVGSFVRSLRPVRAHDYSWQTGALGAGRSRSLHMAAALRQPRPGTFDLSSGFPDSQLLPERLLRSAFNRARNRAFLNSPSPAGSPALRAWFAAELAESMSTRLSAPTADDVVIFPGSQGGLSAAFRSLIGPGEPLIMESPTYWGAILAAAQANVEIVPIPSSAQGPDPSDLERAFAQTGARVFYAQPNYANPTGAQWSPELGHEILETVRRHKAFLIEDDWAHDFAIDSAPQPLAAQDEAGHVIYLRSLTKSVSSSVRVAGVVARGPVRDRLLHATQSESIYVSELLQAAALDVVNQPAWKTHLKNVNEQLASRRDLLLGSLAEYAPQLHIETRPRGGLNLWARLPEGAELSGFIREAELAGVSVVPGDELFPAEPVAPFIRMTYAGRDPGSYPEAAKILGRLLG
ncbi:PLP-dependent aminotransferase family protein [Nesterenkonia sp. MY13]|uniref:PLP-dependent aminotransferase family protein n=1 Tax=Nesterenkonia sedimenti TaxID=1463632 RepID=A0A7X8TID2_9MICC|nr:PLP-dependent aminotransferase family protein [Nesterenkonia sedimenti]NLS09312.1 PLP-dependent aminotransferase family protein [Nesterenkonia sedimenti]